MKKIFGFASVFALAAGFSLSSCSSDDVAEDMNPNYDGNAEVVKTQFSISVPGSVKSSRMTEEETQSGTQASNFQGMKNINVLTFKGAKDMNEPALLAEASIKGSFPLENIEGLEGNAKGKVYSDVKIDLGVDRMLFYGESAYAQAQGQLDADLNFLIGGNIQNIKFSPVQVDAGAANFSTDPQGIQILKVLNNLASVEGWATAIDHSDLKNLYNNFLKLKNGSAVVVAAAASKLHSSLDDLAKREESESVAKLLIAELEKYFQVAGGEGERTLTWKEDVVEPDYSTVVSDFPENLNLPVGVALLAHDGNFAYDTESAGTLNEHKYTTVNDVVSPSSLYYFVNSTLAVSDNNQNLSQQLSAGKAWDAIIHGYSDSKGIVTFQTRSVSLRDKVQYAVAQLRTYVRILNSKIPDMEGKLIAVSEYPVTGILVGGQKTVDWKFEQITSGKAYTVYDNKMPIGFKANKTSYSDTYNSTLVLESETGQNVYVAVEFENNGEDFQGKDGLVKNGSKFYLVAQLKFDEGTGAEDVTKVFQKDYFTNAKLTITKLANAYVTIPDLRAAKMEFGLSVDLSWSQGLTFETDFD